MAECASASSSKMANLPSVDDALRDTPAEKLDQWCSSDDLNDISKSLTRWPEVSPWLGLTETDEEDIRARNDRGISGLKRERVNVLRMWKEKQKERATFRSLIEAFYNAERLDLVDVAIEHLLTIPTSQPPCHQLPTESLAIAQCSALAKYGEYLGDRYKDSVPVFSLQWPPLPIKKAFNLAMIQQARIQRGEICDEYVRMTVTGKVDDILHMKTPVKLEDIFNHDGRKVILIEGAPGAGKSTLSWDICKRWGEGELFQEYEAVILVRLRDPKVQAAETLADFLPAEDKAMAESVAEKIVECKGMNTLFVLDGWDELPHALQYTSIYEKIINPQTNAHLPKCSLIITSRPISSGELRPLMSSRIEIVGFTRGELRQYFSECLCSDSALEALLEKVEENPVVASSCYLPLNAAIIVHLFLSGDQTLPTTVHGIFTSLVLCCLAHYHRERLGLKGEAANLETLDRLPERLQDSFRQLCTLAFLGTMEDRVTFSSADLEALGIPTDVSALGLLQAVPSIVHHKVSVYYNFLHLQIQELLAAYHVSFLSGSKQISHFQMLFHQSRFAAVFQFYAGITQFQSRKKYLSKLALFLPTRLTGPTGIRDVIANMIQTSDIQLLVSVVRCLFEADDPSLCQFVANQLKGMLCLNNTTLSPLDCLSVGYFLSCVCATTKKEFVVYLEKCSIDDYCCKFLMRGLSRCPIPSTTATGWLRMNLWSNNIHDEGAHYIAEVLKNSCILQTLDLDLNSIGNNGVNSLCQALTVNHSLERLSLADNDTITEKGLTLLMECLKSNRGLVKLWLPRRFRSVDVQENVNIARRNNSTSLITVQYFF